MGRNVSIKESSRTTNLMGKEDSLFKVGPIMMVNSKLEGTKDLDRFKIKMDLEFLKDQFLVK